MTRYKAAAEAMCAANRLVLAGHVNPDGDTLGCVLALTHVLRAMGKEALPLSADGVPDIYAWLPGAEWVERETDRRDFDVAIVCDAGGLDRVGKRVIPAIEAVPLVVNIDHHIGERDFGSIRIRDVTAAATAELVWRLIRMLGRAAGMALETAEVADCLMTGLITDTGSFRFLNVTPRTFRLAARLQRLGAAPAPIAERVFENRPFASLKLMGRALDSLRVTADGAVAWARVTAVDFSELGAVDADTEGIVNNVRAVQGARVGILFREVPGHKIRISLRAREGADVNRIAAAFGGGGHRLAAGCSLDMSLADAERAVLAEATKQLNSGTREQESR